MKIPIFEKNESGFGHHPGVFVQVDKNLAQCFYQRVPGPPFESNPLIQNQQDNRNFRLEFRQIGDSIRFEFRAVFLQRGQTVLPVNSNRKDSPLMPLDDTHTPIETELNMNVTDINFFPGRVCLRRNGFRLAVTFFNCCPVERKQSNRQGVEETEFVRIFEVPVNEFVLDPIPINIPLKKFLQGPVHASVLRYILNQSDRTD